VGNIHLMSIFRSLTASASARGRIFYVALLSLY